MARPGRLELPTLCLEGRRSIQLSYGRILGYSLDSTAPARLIRVRILRKFLEHLEQLPRLGPRKGVELYWLNHSGGLPCWIRGGDDQRSVPNSFQVYLIRSRITSHTGPIKKAWQCLPILDRLINRPSIPSAGLLTNILCSSFVELSTSSFPALNVPISCAAIQLKRYKQESRILRQCLTRIFLDSRKTRSWKLHAV
jgi:hypothetical protein